MLNRILTSLGKLSRYFQSETSNLAVAVVTEATITSLEKFDCFLGSASELVSDMRSKAVIQLQQ